VCVCVCVCVCVYARARACARGVVGGGVGRLTNRVAEVIGNAVLLEKPVRVWSRTTSDNANRKLGSDASQQRRWHKQRFSFPQARLAVSSLQSNG
jgi:hypothetical protein